MILPEGIQRENNKLYEEVKIPYSEPMPIGFEEKPVYIEDLDEVRWAFLPFILLRVEYVIGRFVLEKIDFKIKWLIQYRNLLGY